MFVTGGGGDKPLHEPMMIQYIDECMHHQTPDITYSFVFWSNGSQSSHFPWAVVSDRNRFNTGMSYERISFDMKFSSSIILQSYDDV